MAPDQETRTGSHRAARGFAAMDPEMQRAIARKGGEAVSGNREHMSQIGRKGAEARNERRLSSSGRSSSPASFESGPRGVQR